MIRRFRGDSMARLAIRQSNAVREAIRDEVKLIGDEVAEYFSDVVSDWDTKPKFSVRVTVNDKKIALNVVAVGAGADRWRWISRGTGQWGPKRAKYPIRPKGDYPLRFRGGYSAKTAAVAQHNVGDGSRSGDWTSTYEVMHPGIEPRKFEEESQNRIKPTFSRRVNNRIRREVRKISR